MIRFLAISLLAFFTSCSLKTTEGLRPVSLNKAEIENPYFSNPNKDYVYKAKIVVYGKYFGGILIVKKIGAESHRIVLTTEFGSKLFDFQFEGDIFTKNFAVEALSKKIVLNILCDDLKLLVTEKAAVLETYESELEKVYKTKQAKRFNYYFFKDETKKLHKIVNTSRTDEKVKICFVSSEGKVADSITIKHNNIKLEVSLKKI